jgi:hypothetical protein
MNAMTEQLTYEHLADLRRDAAGHGRAAARADRAGGAGGAGRAGGSHRAAWAGLRPHRASAVGCEA